MTDSDRIEVRLITPKAAPGPIAGSDSSLVLHDPVSDRYGPLRSISWWDQDLLRRSSAMVVGAGALGNEVLKNLALMGIGRIVLVDFDRVEQGNLSCAPLYRTSDAGRLKVEAAAEAIKDLNPEVDVQPLDRDIMTGVGLGLIRRMDIVVGCLDNHEARLALNRACYQLGLPWVDGAIQELLGVARIFWPGRGACYECTLTEADWKAIRHRYSCMLLAREGLIEGKVSTTPILAAIIGGVQAQEALKILHGMEVEPGRGLIFNGLSNYVYSTTYPRRRDCQTMDCYFESIEELIDARADTTSVGELLELGRQRLGGAAAIELGFELVTEFYCSSCREGETVFEPLRQLNAGRACCPVCGEQRQPRSTHSLTDQEAYIDRKLAQVGIPPLHIVTLRHGNDYHHFELSGDSY